MSNTCIRSTKLFNPSTRVIKVTDSSLIAQEGPRVLSEMDLSDMTIPFEKQLLTEVRLEHDDKDYPVNLSGFGDNFTFIAIRVIYDIDNRLDNCRYLKWRTSEDEEFHPIQDFMILTGNTTCRWPMLLFTNETGYVADIQILAAKRDNIRDFFENKTEEVSDNTVISGLRFDDIKSMDSDLNLYIHPAGETNPIAYTTAENLVNFELNHNVLEIDDSAMGELVLSFVDAYNAKQAYAAIMWWLTDPLNKELPQTADNDAPVINWNSLRSAPLSDDIDDRYANIFLDYNPFDTDNVADKQSLLEYFIDDIIDAREGEYPLDAYLLKIFKGGDEQEVINSLGEYQLELQVQDNACNKRCAYIRVTSRPADQWVDPDNYTLDFNTEWDNNTATFTPVLSNPYISGTYSWDFDDGGTSTDEAPNYVYTAGGGYDVTLVFTPDDSELTTRTVTKTVIVPAPSYSISFESTLIITPTSREVEYTVSNTGTLPPGEYIWDFGDGSTLTTTDTVVNHSYAVGSYNVLLTYQPSNTLLPVSTTDVVNTNNPTWSLWFDTIVTYNSSNNFEVSTNVQNDGPSISGTFTWDFGLGYPADSGNNGLVEYSAGEAGNDMPVRLTFDSDTENLIWTIEQSVKLRIVDFNFSFNLRNGTFNGSNTGSDDDGYLWAFGDGFTTTEANISTPVTHLYSVDDTFDVTLEWQTDTITNPNEEQLVRRIKSVTPFSINYVQNQIGSTTEVELTATKTASNSEISGQFTWNLGGFGTHTGNVITVDFLNPGTYSGTLSFLSFDSIYTGSIPVNITVI